MNRVENLLNNINCKGNQAVVLHSPSNMFYMSGYNGEGLLLIANNIKAIITDFRYTEQAENQAPDFSIHMIENNKKHNDILFELLKSKEISEVYYEEDFLPVKAYEELRKILNNINFLALNEEVQQIRRVKDKEEVDNIKKACKITSDSFMELLPYIKENMSEKELTARLEYIMKLKGSMGLAFSTICAAGKNGSLPHAIPSEYKIKSGDMITFDFGAKWNGYCADMTRTVALGKPSDTMINVYNVVKKAQELGKEALKAGAICSEVDAASRNYINSMGFEGRFGHGLGHSLGIDIHESPYLNARSSDIIKLGNIMTVEPGIYIPGVGGVRIEDTCEVLQDGNIALTEPTRELIIL